MMTNEFKCNSCGANLTFVEGEVKVVCEYCGTQSVKNIPTTVVNEITQVTEVTQITEVTGNAPTVESLTDRGFILLEDAKWHEAFDYFKRALAINPHYAKAYIGMLCAEEGIAQENYLAHHYIKPLMKYPHFERALRFADNEYRQVLEGYLQTSTVVGARTRRRNRITGFLRTISVLLFMASAGVFVYATVAN
ncbi:MAG: tetratricopeptide repeat protein, partial [Defluviitaleaceae bacterium]|nr:tetratricopeptide repeat protein [Defluviitaleaceae bacterium]